jgi:hypothetical protein
MTLTGIVTVAVVSLGVNVFVAFTHTKALFMAAVVVVSGVAARVVVAQTKLEFENITSKS